MPTADRQSPAVLLTPVMAAEGGFGLAMRAGLLLEGLARDHAVHVVVAPVFGPPGEASPLVRRRATGLTVLPLDYTADPVADFLARLSDPSSRAAAEALHPRPALCSRATLETAGRVAELAAAAPLVVVHRLYLAPLLDRLLGAGDRPACVLDVDDVESLTHRQRNDVEEAAAYERMERHYLPRLDSVLACSDDDAAYLRGLAGGAPVHVIPNAVPEPVEVPGTDHRHDLVFVGNLSYAPNVAGAQWLCREVLPQLPGVTAALVGRDPVAEVRALAAPGRVTVSGTVPDVAPWYAGARVAAVPLPAGGGTSIKTIEAIAHRRPVVSTATGVRGLPLRAGRDVLVADSADEFASACGALLASPERASAMVTAAAESLGGRFTVDCVASGLAALLAAATVRR